MSNLETQKTYALVASPKNKKLISGLRESGENLLIIPSILTEKVDLTEQTRNSLTNISDFDWLILTDVFSVDYFIEALREIETDLFELDALMVCALGEAVADRLRFVQIHADVIPVKLDTESVFTTIAEYTANELTDLRFLLLKENKSCHPIAEKLKAARAIVEELAVYSAGFEDESENIRLKTLLTGGAADEFVFSSAEDLESLKFLFPDEELVSVLAEIKVSATSENAFQTLLENGLRPLYFQNK